MQNKRLYPDISALVYNAVTLHIEEFRSPVGNGAALGCPVLDGHGFPGSFHLNSSQFHHQMVFDRLKGDALLITTTAANGQVLELFGIYVSLFSFAPRDILLNRYMKHLERHLIVFERGYINII